VNVQQQQEVPEEVEAAQRLRIHREEVFKFLIPNTTNISY
jgi:hypothetical protein